MTLDCTAKGAVGGLTKFFVCVDGVCVRDGKFLLLKRSVEPFKGYWHVAGGHIEENETLIEALKREFKEETNLDIEVGEIVAGRLEQSPDRTKLIVAFRVSVLGGEIRLNGEHEAYGWFSEFPSDCVYDYSKHLK